MCVCEVEGVGGRGWTSPFKHLLAPPRRRGEESRRMEMRAEGRSARRPAEEGPYLLLRRGGFWAAGVLPSTPTSFSHLLPVFYIPLPSCRHVCPSPCVSRLSGPAARDKATINCGGCAEGTWDKEARHAVPALGQGLKQTVQGWRTRESSGRCH